MKDQPYSILKQNARSYQIMLLRDQEGRAFPWLAREFGISYIRVRQIYYQTKLKQIHLYLDHIAASLNHENARQIYKVFNAAYDSYQSWECVCAYLEKEHPDLLSAYRDGEPGMPLQFLQALPPLKPKLGKKTVARLIELRETEKMSYRDIAKRLRITPEKAKYAYGNFYHKQAQALLDDLIEKAGKQNEKSAIWEYYYQKYKNPKKRYDAIAQKQSFF